MRDRILILLFLLACFSNIDLNSQEFRALDGYNNNLLQPEWGTSNSVLTYWSKSDYADGIGEAKLDLIHNRPNPRVVSNKLFAQGTNHISDAVGWSDYVWVFSQFIYNDLIQIEKSPLEELNNIIIPNDDPFFEPGIIIKMNRARAAPGTGTSPHNPRKHINRTTSFLDGSTIYGYDSDRAQWLQGDRGKLKVSEGNYLPWNTITGEFNSPLDPGAPFMADATSSLRKMFVAGDERANESPLLISLHTIFVREHNRRAEEMAINHPDWSDDRIYEEARKWNIAMLQSIVYNEWLPIIGIRLPEYRGFDISKNPTIANEFASAGFKLGYTLSNSRILRLDNEGNDLPQGPIQYREAYFNPYLITLGNGLEPFLKGMGVQRQQRMDIKMVDDIRNMDLRQFSEKIVDLPALAINKGRDRGLPDFNTLRRDLGLPAYHSFLDLTGFGEDAKKIQEVYGSIEYLDPWVGMLSETRGRTQMMGQTMSTMMEIQFTDLRDGDRFYFENDRSFSSRDIEEIKNTRLYDIIMRNSELTLMQKQVFIASSADDLLEGPEIEKVDLNAVIYPNPTYGNTFIKVYSGNDRSVMLTVFNTVGQIIDQRSVQLFKGDNIIDMNLTRSIFPQGLYYVKLQHPGEVKSLKVIKR